MYNNIELPPIRDDSSGYKYLFKLANKIISDPYHHFNFEFKKCSILEQNAVAMLGGLAKYVDAHNSILNSAFGTVIAPKCRVMFKVDTMSSLIRKELINNNFLSHFSRESFTGYPTGEYIGYREHTKHLDSDEIASHLYHEWLTEEKLSITKDLKYAIISRIFEIFMNAYGHGVLKSKMQGLGVISCGQYDTKKGQLKLTVLDFGAGVIKNVKDHIKSLNSYIENSKTQKALAV